MSGTRPVLVIPENTGDLGTSVAAVIGDPISHSLSPRLHNAAFAALGLDWVYVACRVPKGQGAQAIEDMRALGLKGLPVTMPHKAEAALAVDTLSDTAKKLGVINCVRVEDERLIGENTDGVGFLNSLKSQMGIGVDDLRVVILGAGGAARSIALTLAENGAEVGICNRTEAAAQELVDMVGNESFVVDQKAIKSAELIINATSLGMNINDPMPFDVNLLEEGQRVVDLIYKPEKTVLLKEAEVKGLETLNGLGMLLYQAGEQFRLWTGEEAPIHEMAQSIGLAF